MSTTLKYRMGAGFAGDVNRTHPASIEPVLIDSAAPPTFYGQPVVIDPTTQGIRPLTSGDSALIDIWGVLVRPYPTQQSAGTNFGAVSIGAATPPTSGVADVLKLGYIMVPVNGSTKKGGTVYIWIAASSGAHVQGGFEAAPTSGSTIQLAPKYFYNGVPDSNGVVELIIRD